MSTVLLCIYPVLTRCQKIPPRITFAAQCAGIIVSWLTQTGVNLWAMANINHICESEADNNVSIPLNLYLDRLSLILNS